MWVLGFHIPTSFARSPHVGQAIFKFGYTAVDLFFILSGFILATAHPFLTVRTSRDFFWKRIFRIYPLHICIMCALALGLVACSYVQLNVNGDGHYNWIGFPLSLLLLKPYFPHLPGEWNSATWSIGIELGCYCTLPLVLPFVRHWNKFNLWLAVVSIAATMTVWFAQSTDDFANAGLAAFFRGSLDFYLGCCLGVAVPALPQRLMRHAGSVAIIAIVGIVAACILGIPALIPLFSGVLIAALSLNYGMVAAWLSVPALVWLGRVSYSIYLIHLPVFTITNKLLPIDRLPLPHLLASTLKDALVTVFVLYQRPEGTTGMRTGLAWRLRAKSMTYRRARPFENGQSFGPLVLILSDFSYRLIETPGRRLPLQLGLLTTRSAGPLTVNGD